MKDKHRLPFLFHGRIWLFLAMGFLGALAAVSSRAADTKPPIEPRADELLKRMGDFLGGSPFFSVDAEIWQDVESSSGLRLQAGRVVNLEVRRPNRLHAEVHSTHRNRELFYDGTDLTLFNRAENFYGTAHTTGPLDTAMDAASERFGIEIPLEDFIRSDPHKDLMEKATAGSDIGPIEVMGVPCEHLAFSQTNIDWQVWIADGPQPVPRKFVITYKDEPNSPQFTAIFSNWDFNTKLPDFVFKFEPPPGAEKIKVKDMKADLDSQKGGAK